MSKIILKIGFLALYPIMAFIRFFDLVRPIIENGLEEAQKKAKESNVETLYVISLILFSIYIFPLTLLPFVFGFFILYSFYFITNYLMSFFYNQNPPLEHTAMAMIIMTMVFGILAYKESKKEINSSSNGGE
jgi:hypothetical protein